MNVPVSILLKANRHIFLGILLCLIRLTSSSQVISTDYDALVALYNATDGPNWTDNTNWLSGDVSTWYGITITGDRVTAINLGNNNLNGTIPLEIGNLTGLVTLDLDFNTLTGSIPPEIGSMALLEDFDLNHNQLTGPIPTEIENLSVLKRIDFNNNQLAGNIPVELGNIAGLEILIINNNNLIGSLPSELGNLTTVQNFDFHNNQLTGTIPTTIGNLTLVTKIHLQGNELTGAVPNEVTSLTLLEDFGIHTNQLSGVPDLTSLSNLSSLRLESNRFEFDDLEPNSGITGVVYDPQSNIAAPSDQILNPGDLLDVTISVGGSANQYQWFKDGSALSGQTSDNLFIESVSSLDAGSYHLSVTNALVPGLTLLSESLMIYVEPVNQSIHVYNVVTPNGDGKHDFLKIERISEHPGNRVSIFDRWGRMVYQATDYDNTEVKFEGYNTEGNKQRLPNGTYFYVIETGDEKTTGHIQISTNN